MKKVRNIAVIVLSVICVGILVFLLWNLRSTEESAQEIIPEVQPEPMSEQSVSDSDVSGNGAGTVQILRNCRRQKKANRWKRKIL